MKSKKQFFEKAAKDVSERAELPETVASRKIPRDEIEEMLAIHAVEEPIDSRGRMFNGSHADLRSYDFSGRNLRYAKFIGADLRGANFTGCDLSDAHFEDADLRRAIFTDARMKDTYFHYANMSTAKGLTAHQIRTSQFSSLAEREDRRRLTRLPADVYEEFVGKIDLVYTECWYGNAPGRPPAERRRLIRKARKMHPFVHDYDLRGAKRVDYKPPKPKTWPLDL